MRDKMFQIGFPKRVLVVASLVGILGSCANPGTSTELPLDRSVRGALGLDQVAQTEALRAPRAVLFTSAAEWAAFCSRLGVKEAPTIDFDAKCVFAVFLGEKPSSGYSVRIEAITYHGPVRPLEVLVRTGEPARTAGALAVMTYPADLVTFPRPDGFQEYEVEYVDQ